MSELPVQVYRQRLKVEQLRRETFATSDPMASESLFDELINAEGALADLEGELAARQAADSESGLLVTIGRSGGYAGTLGAQTTGLSAEVHLRMAQVPTSIYHLLDSEANPLVTCSVSNTSNHIRRLRVSSYIEGYSARAIKSVEIAPQEKHTFDLLPTLFPDNLESLNEITRATLNVLVEDLDDGKIESHTTHPIWLLARTTAPLAVNDPTSGQAQDLTPYLGAFVTPNEPSLMQFLRAAAALHPQGRLAGYQGSPAVVEPQVRALFEALKQTAEITYVNSVIAFSPDQGASKQRVRLPRESLAHAQANCIDGTVLFASLLEAISLSPGLAIVPGHAFVAWETWKDESAEWRFLETTMIGAHGFEEACTHGEANAARYKALAEATENPALFRLWPLRELRTDRNIVPME
jgi:hypothetical protein